SLGGGVTWACLGGAAIMCISPLQYGYHIAELNTPKGIITGCDQHAPVQWRSLPLCLPMSDAMYSLATSVFAVGGLVGSLVAGWMTERWGRRGALIYNNVPFIVGPLLMALAVSPAMLAVGRFISGVGAGAAVVITPLYLSEIAPVKYRGTLNLLNQLSIVLGILAAMIVGMLANRGPYWRVSVGVGLILACLHLLLAAFAPESPRYLWRCGREAEARTILRRLRGVADVDSETAAWRTGGRSPRLASSQRLEAEQSACSDGSSEEASVTIFNIFRIARYRRPWLLVLLLHFGQQLSGINTVFFFSSSVLEKMFSSELSSILTMLIGVLNVLGTAFAALIVDRFGRRPLLLSSIGGMVVSVALLGVSLGLGLNILAAVSLYLVVVSFAPGFGPVPFLLGTELFDVRAAGAGGSWGLAANWIGTFIVATLFLPLLNMVGEWVFAVFVVALLVVGVVFYSYIPETKGR
ncbi:general substrate transporter, partial [Coemansia reversa NRRL 1564]